MFGLGRLRFSLMPPAGLEFYELFEASALNMIETADKTCQLFRGETTSVAEAATEVGRLEEQGDHLTHRVMQLLHRSFITPFDRSEIANLAHSLDEVADMLEDAVAHVNFYHVEPKEPVAARLAELTLAQSRELSEALRLLRDSNNGEMVLSKTVEINRLENEADNVLRRGLADLMTGGMSPLDVIRWRDIYEILEGATDRAEDVANILEGIVLERA